MVPLYGTMGACVALGLVILTGDYSDVVRLVGCGLVGIGCGGIGAAIGVLMDRSNRR